MVLLTALAGMLCPPLDAATPFFKCTVNGSVTYQSDPCPTGEVRPRPTVQQLNAERQLKLKQSAERGAAQPAARPAMGLDVPDKPSGASPAASPAPAAAADAERRPFTLDSGGAGAFKCDGRKYCSQMTSCAEAKFFLARCPGVKMDSDGDGIPCERQWCGH